VFPTTHSYLNTSASHTHNTCTHYTTATLTRLLHLQKLDRFKQWAGERMGGEAKTSTSDEFKSLEMEMNLRQDGTAPPAPLSGEGEGLPMLTD